MSRIVECPNCGHHLAVSGPDRPDDPSLTVETALPTTVVTDLDLPFEPPDDDDDDLNGVPCLSMPAPVPRSPRDEAKPDGPISRIGIVAADLLATSDPDQFLNARLTVNTDSPLNWSPAETATAAPASAAPMPAEGPQASMAPVPARRGLGWAFLASYASAVTLGLAWVLWNEPSRLAADRGGLSPSIVTDARLPARRAPAGPRSRVVDPAPEPAVTADHLIPLGEARRVGDLEITPLGIERASDLELENLGIDGGRNVRPAGEDVLLLRLRLTNRSATTAYVPLSADDVRLPDEGLPGTFLEDDNGNRVYPYPLPVQSDWSIVHQRLGELKPGESVDTFLASDQDAVRRLSQRMIWRFRARTGQGGDDALTLGVPFDRDEVR